MIIIQYFYCADYNMAMGALYSTLLKYAADVSLNICHYIPNLR